VTIEFPIIWLDQSTCGLDHQRSAGGRVEAVEIFSENFSVKY